MEWSFDRVRYVTTDGVRQLSTEEFRSLPLNERVQGLVEHRFEFTAGGKTVPPREALASMGEPGLESADVGAERLGAALDGVASHSADHAIGHSDGLLIAVWRRDGMTAERLQSIVDLRDQVLRSEFRGAMHVAERSMGLPSAEVREAMRRTLKSRKNGDRSPIAVVLRGEGFALSALRGVATTVFLVQSISTTRICAEVPEALAWLCGHPKLYGASMQRLADAVDTLRALGTTQSAA